MPTDEDSPGRAGHVRVDDDPTPAQLAGIDALLARARAVDPAPPLNEAALLALKHPRRDGYRHLLARYDQGDPLGYAQLAPDGTGQVVVDPPYRRQGVGRRLVGALLDLAATGDTPLRVWALGDSPAAQALAARTGLVASRVLLEMSRPLAGLPDPAVPDGVTIEPFRVGLDEQAWLAVNARAFAHHPEQGSIDAEDLAERMGEDWFDPAGFFLARTSASASEWSPTGGVGGRPASRQSIDEPDGSVLGFQWTKQHGVEDGRRTGEVYVLGVDPDAQGHGLAKALLLTGLAHLRDTGDEVVELYVEASEAGPVALYRKYGFAEVSRDVMYAAPGPSGA